MRKSLSATLAAGLLLTMAIGPAGAADPLAGQEAIATEAIYLRSTPGFTGDAVDTLRAGSIVYVTGEPRQVDSAGWYPVEQDGRTGWASAAFLQARDYTGIPAGTPTEGRSTTGEAVSSRGAGRPSSLLTKQQEAVAIEDVRLRATPGVDQESLEVLPAGSLVYVMDGPRWLAGVGWYQVEQDGRIGWATAELLAGPEAQAAVEARSKRVATGPSAGGIRPAPKLTVGREAVATDNVRLRGAAGSDQKTLTVLPYGSRVYVAGGPELVGDSAWYRVEQDGQVGWANGEFIEPWTAEAAGKAYASRLGRAGSAPASTSGGDTRTTAGDARTTAGDARTTAGDARTTAGGTSARGATPSATSRGSSIAGAGVSYVGTPYVWGGTTPRGWDCSGFTSYVLAQYGIYPGRTTYAQWASGRPVATSQLEPGDLVFFANTFGPGISHVGIYIGGGRMVSASSERTGTRIDSVFDPYWGAHYAGARRYT